MVAWVSCSNISYCQASAHVASPTAFWEHNKSYWLSGRKTTLQKGLLLRAPNEITPRVYHHSHDLKRSPASQLSLLIRARAWQRWLLMWAKRDTLNDNIYKSWKMTWITNAKWPASKFKSLKQLGKMSIVLVLFIIAYLGISLFNWSFELNLFKLINHMPINKSIWT